MFPRRAYHKADAYGDSMNLWGDAGAMHPLYIRHWPLKYAVLGAVQLNAFGMLYVVLFINNFRHCNPCWIAEEIRLHIVTTPTSGSILSPSNPWGLQVEQSRFNLESATAADTDLSVSTKVGTDDHRLETRVKLLPWALRRDLIELYGDTAEVHPSGFWPTSGKRFPVLVIASQFSLL